MSMNPINPGPFEPIAATLRTNLNDDPDRVEELAGGVFRLCGFIEFDGAGELIVSVPFPVMFTEKPSFSFGGELRENSPMQNGKLPTVSGVILSWKYTTAKDTGRRMYAGASIGIVTTGIREQLFEFHYQLEAAGIRQDTDAAPPSGPPLLGDLWVNGTLFESPAALGVGEGFGPVYIGAADLDPDSVVVSIDGDPVAFDGSASADPSGFLVLQSDMSTVGGPPYSTGLLLLTFLALANGSHTLVVTVNDVDGNTHTKMWTIVMSGGGGGGT